MKKSILLLFLIVSVVCSAKEIKIQTESLIPKDTLKVKKKVRQSFEDGKAEELETITFFYENNLVSRIETVSGEKITENVEIKYQDGKIKEMKWNSKPLKSINEMSVLITYDYDKDLIVSSLLTEGQKKKHYRYIYNDLKQLIKRQATEEGKTVTEVTYSYDKKGNLSLSKHTSNDKSKYSDYKTFYKSYDDKFNSFRLLYSEAYLKIVSIGKNNILNSYDNDGGGVDKYEYEYNSENYPTKITRKNNNEIKSITIIEYE